MNKWRLPTRNELLKAYENKVDGFGEDYYWSSATLADFSDYAWYVGFYCGCDGWYDKDYDFYVRLIKDGDKLEWHKDIEYMNWYKAQDYVKEMNTKGLSNV